MRERDIADPIAPGRFGAPNDPRTLAVVKAVDNFDLGQSPSWDDLDVSSTETSIDGVHVDPNGILFETKDRFSGVANVYVVLKYGAENEHEFTTSDSFIGEFRGHFDEAGKAAIDEVSVDTSPLYEGTDASG